MMKVYTGTIPLLCGLLLSTLMLTGCASPKGENVQDKRYYIEDKREMALRWLNRKYDGVEQELQEAPGYMVLYAKEMFYAFAGGVGFGGILTDNRNGEELYMRGSGLGVGLGIGGKHYYMIMVIQDETFLDELKTEGYIFKRGTATAHAGMVNERADEILNENHYFDSAFKLYILDESGIQGRVSVDGGRIWPSEELNTYEDEVESEPEVDPERAPEIAADENDA